MSIALNKPLAWTSASTEEIKLLENLQGNILKGHGRHFTGNIFFQLDPAQKLEGKRLLRDLANHHLTSAHRQLLDTEEHKINPNFDTSNPFWHLALSQKGTMPWVCLRPLQMMPILRKA